jgi:anti-sigma B factor antagonist
MTDDGCPLAPDPTRWSDPDWRDNLGDLDTFDRMPIGPLLPNSDRAARMAVAFPKRPSSQGSPMKTPRTDQQPKVERSGNITVITFSSGAIRDVENILACELEGNTGGSGDRHILLDFTHVVRLNSLELGTLVSLHKEIARSGGRLTLFNINAEVFQLFSLTRLDTFLGIARESKAEATTPQTIEAGKPR